MVPTKLALEWEAKLRAEGLGALDKGNPGTTRAPDHVDTPRDEETLASRVRVEFWSQASTAAQRLPHGYRCRPFLQRAAELGNVNRASRECGLTQKAGEWAWRKFLVFAGLPAPLVKGSPGRKRPTRDGLVRIEAGRYREERAA